MFGKIVKSIALTVPKWGINATAFVVSLIYGLGDSAENAYAAYNAAKAVNPAVAGILAAVAFVGTFLGLRRLSSDEVNEYAHGLKKAYKDYINAERPEGTELSFFQYAALYHKVMAAARTATKEADDLGLEDVAKANYVTARVYEHLAIEEKRFYLETCNKSPSQNFFQRLFSKRLPSSNEYNDINAAFVAGFAGEHENIGASFVATEEPADANEVAGKKKMAAAAQVAAYNKIMAAACADIKEHFVKKQTLQEIIEGRAKTENGPAVEGVIARRLRKEREKNADPKALRKPEYSDYKNSWAPPLRFVLGHFVYDLRLFGARVSDGWSGFTSAIHSGFAPSTNPLEKDLGFLASVGSFFKRSVLEKIGAFFGVEAAVTAAPKALLQPVPDLAKTRHTVMHHNSVFNLKEQVHSDITQMEELRKLFLGAHADGVFSEANVHNYSNSIQCSSTYATRQFNHYFKKSTLKHQLVSENDRASYFDHQSKIFAAKFSADKIAQFSPQDTVIAKQMLQADVLGALQTIREQRIETLDNTAEQVLRDYFSGTLKIANKDVKDFVGKNKFTDIEGHLRVALFGKDTETARNHAAAQLQKEFQDKGIKAWPSKFLEAINDGTQAIVHKKAKLLADTLLFLEEQAKQDEEELLAMIINGYGPVVLDTEMKQRLKLGVFGSFSKQKKEDRELAITEIKKGRLFKQALAMKKEARRKAFLAEFFAEKVAQHNAKKLDYVVRHDYIARLQAQREKLTKQTLKVLKPNTAKHTTGFMTNIIAVLVVLTDTAMGFFNGQNLLTLVLPGILGLVGLSFVAPLPLLIVVGAVMAAGVFLAGMALTRPSIVKVAQSLIALVQKNPNKLNARNVAKAAFVTLMAGIASTGAGLFVFFAIGSLFPPALLFLALPLSIAAGIFAFIEIGGFRGPKLYEETTYVFRVFSGREHIPWRELSGWQRTKVVGVGALVFVVAGGSFAAAFFGVLQLSAKIAFLSLAIAGSVMTPGIIIAIVVGLAAFVCMAALVGRALYKVFIDLKRDVAKKSDFVEDGLEEANAAGEDSALGPNPQPAPPVQAAALAPADNMDFAPVVAHNIASGAAAVTPGPGGRDAGVGSGVVDSVSAVMSSVAEAGAPAVDAFPASQALALPTSVPAAATASAAPQSSLAAVAAVIAQPALPAETSAAAAPVDTGQRMFDGYRQAQPTATFPKVQPMVLPANVAAAAIDAAEDDLATTTETPKVSSAAS